MNPIIADLVQNEKFGAYLQTLKNDQILISGLSDMGKVQVIGSTNSAIPNNILVITYNELKARQIFQDIKFFTDKVIYFPKKELVTYDYIAGSHDLLHERIDNLNKIFRGEANIIVVGIECLMQNMIAKDTLYQNIISLKTGEEVELEILKEKLVHLGYERYEQIEGRGQFSLRGGIVDIAVSKEYGIRIEFFGNAIDSIRKFKIQTRRSEEMLENWTIYPCHEYILERKIDLICRDILSKSYTQKKRMSALEDVEMIKAGRHLSKIDKYFDCFYQESSSLLDYLENDTVLMIDEIEKIKQRAESIISENLNVVQSLLEREKIVPNAIESMRPYEKCIKDMQKKRNVFLERQELGFTSPELKETRHRIHFNYREINYYKSEISHLFDDIKQKRDKKIVLVCGNEEKRKAFEKLLSENDITANDRLLLMNGTISCRV